MQTSSSSFATLSDQDLLLAVKRLARDERQATVELIASLIELDTRRLYLGEGCSSLFTYCTRALCLSEHAAYNRIEAARAARRFPVILEWLAEGALTLTAVTLLAPHLTPSNHRTALAAARHRSKRDVERQVAGLRPRPDVPSFIRRQPPVHSAVTPAPVMSSETARVPAAAGGIPVAGGVPRAGQPADREAASPPDTPLFVDSEPGPARTASSPMPPPRPVNRRWVVEPLTPERYKVQVTVGVRTIETLRRVQDLMRHTVPDGDPAVILDRALRLLLEHLERTKLAATERPRARRGTRRRSRHIPAAVRRAVWMRDEGQCTFVGAEGRCGERGGLELHHREPYALGGEASVEHITLRCRAHNAYEAEQDFGLRPSAYSRRSPLMVRERDRTYGTVAGTTRSGTSRSLTCAAPFAVAASSVLADPTPAAREATAGNRAWECGLSDT